MTKVNQKKATINTLLAVLSDRGEEYTPNSDYPISEVLTDSDKAKTRDILFTMFKQGEIEYKESFQHKVDDDAKLKSYVSGLVNNWVRKAKELNCGESYVPKNPGSRAGSQDEMIKELRKAMKVCAESDKPKFQEAIDARLAEIKPEAKVEINVDALPEHLRGLVTDEQ